MCDLKGGIPVLHDFYVVYIDKKFFSTLSFHGCIWVSKKVD